MTNRALFNHWWERLKVSWWLVPSAFVLGAVGLSVGMQMLDERLGSEVTPSWAQFHGSIAGARSVLSAIAASMMTFSGLVFSVTVLVLQLASTQFSPRVLRTFLEDRRSQTFLGLFVGTFVYALLGLANIKSLNQNRITSIPVWVGILLAVGCVVGLIFYVHHVVQSIRASTIIRRVGDETREALAHLYPEGIGQDISEPESDAPEAPAALVIPYWGVSGMIEQIDEQALFEFAEKADITIGLACGIGEFVGHATPLLYVWGDANAANEKDLSALVQVGNNRNITQDTLCGFRELVDIAGRALSPSLNDPTTAVQVLDQLEDLLLRLARRRFPSPLRYSKQGRLRLYLPRPDWDSCLRLALDEIRQYGRSSLQVARRLRALLDHLACVVPAFRRDELARQKHLLELSVKEAFHTTTERRMASAPSRQGHGPF